MKRVVVVGGSLAGFRAAEALREQGYAGALVVVGAERGPAYDRPPLSKQVLAGVWGPERTTLPVSTDDLEADLLLGRTAVSLDLANQEVELDGGERVGFDGLVIATGAVPRTLPDAGHREGVYTLRTLADCLAIRSDLEASPRRVVVVGAGFIGAEVAATCRQRGSDVTLVEALPVPLGRVLGDTMGALLGDLHRENGVDVRLGVGVEGLDGSPRVERVRLADGSAVDADLVVVGIGVAPATGWLAGSGLEITDGIVCDETCLAAPGVVAAGDVARWPNRRFGVEMRVEHWDNALEQGAAAATRLLAGDAGGTPYEPIPWFWSDQYDRKLQLAGWPVGHDEVRVVDGDTVERRFVALYRKADDVVAVLGINRPRQVAQWRHRIAARVRWDEALRLAAEEGAGG